MSDAQEFEQPGEMDMVGGSSAVEGREMALPPWMEELPEPDIAFARTKGWSRPADLIRQYRDLETMVGPDQVRIPGEGATPVEMEAFWSRLGRPATTDGYTFSPGESATGYDTDLADWFRDAAHEVNMPVDMAEALHDRFLETRMEEAAAHWQADQARGAETAATLGREWGSAYDANLDLARRAVTEVGGDDLKEALEVSGMGNDPALIRTFAGIGRRL